MEAELTFKGHKVAKGKAEGEALVTQKSISFFGGISPMTGLVTEKGHEIEGVSVVGKILIFPEEKGSSGGAYQLNEMRGRNTAPKALINRRADPIVALGAIVGDIPMMDRLDPDPFELIKTGDWVSVDADKGVVKVKRKSQ